MAGVWLDFRVDELVPRQITRRVKLLRALVAFIPLFGLGLVDHNMGIQSTAVLEDFSAKLANSFLIFVDVFVVETEILLVVEKSKALWARDRLFESLLSIFLSC